MLSFAISFINLTKTALLILRIYSIMKKLLLFVAAFLIMALPTVAQETDLSEEEFKQKIDSVFEHVDMTSVETGILIEHGFNLLDPNVFNGQKLEAHVLAVG